MSFSQAASLVSHEDDGEWTQTGGTAADGPGSAAALTSVRRLTADQQLHER